jgi:hypothetical protein
VKGNELCSNGNREYLDDKTTIAAMLSSMSAYEVQLVILEPNETLDTDEIKFLNLTKLKLMYPSITNDYVSQKRRFLKRNIEKSTIFSLVITLHAALI